MNSPILDENSSSATGTSTPIALSSTSTPPPYIYVDQVRLQNLENQIERLKNFDQKVITHLSNAHTVLYTINMIWKVFILLFALLMGCGLFIVLYKVEIIDKMYSAGFSVAALVIGLIIFIFMARKIPDDFKKLKADIESTKQNVETMKSDIKEIDSKLASIQISCQNNHSRKN